MDEELTRRVVADLSRQRNRDDIIQMVCEQAGMEWPQAEQLVKQVEIEQAHTIARKQAPLLIVLSTVTVAAGLALVFYSFSVLREILRGDILTIVLGLAAAYSPLMLGGMGLAMITGELVGLNNTYRRYFET